MNNKLRIRIGEVEIEYEGTEEFLKQELPSLLQKVMELRKAAGKTGVDSGDGGNGTGQKGQQLTAGTTGTIAARLQVKSGPELLIAAAARLTLVQQANTFSRQDLLTEMQSASHYYKKSYSNNLTKYFSRAVKAGDLRETATDTFALGATARARLEKELADV